MIQLINRTVLYKKVNHLKNIKILTHKFIFSTLLSNLLIRIWNQNFRNRKIGSQNEFCDFVSSCRKKSFSQSSFQLNFGRWNELFFENFHVMYGKHNSSLDYYITDLCTQPSLTWLPLELDFVLFWTLESAKGTVERYIVFLFV